MNRVPAWFGYRRRSGFRRLALDVVLAMLVFIAQQAAVEHALSHLGHASPRTLHDDQVPPDQVCAKCVAYLGIGHAVGSTHVVPLVHAEYAWLTTVSLIVFVVEFPLAYSARAPPSSLA